jgi:ABC-type polysaccharide/polyol phosphate transport system ATPase subunit
MRVRLAFAVAGTPERERSDHRVEVLAVGDSVFQRAACEDGRDRPQRPETILLVSTHGSISRSVAGAEGGGRGRGGGLGGGGGG